MVRYPLMRLLMYGILYSLCLFEAKGQVIDTAYLHGQWRLVATKPYTSRYLNSTVDASYKGVALNAIDDQYYSVYDSTKGKNQQYSYKLDQRDSLSPVLKTKKTPYFLIVHYSDPDSLVLSHFYTRKKGKEFYHFYNSYKRTDKKFSGYAAMKKQLTDHQWYFCGEINKYSFDSLQLTTTRLTEDSCRAFDCTVRSLSVSKTPYEMELNISRSSGCQTQNSVLDGVYVREHYPLVFNPDVTFTLGNKTGKHETLRIITLSPQKIMLLKVPRD